MIPGQLGRSSIPVSTKPPTKFEKVCGICAFGVYIVIAVLVVLTIIF